MAEIVSYKPGAYCQIKFPTRERVLISCAQTGIKIMKMSLGGLLPTMTIADWPLSNLGQVISIFADPQNPALHPLDAIKNRLMTCSSISEVQGLCRGGGTAAAQERIISKPDADMIFAFARADWERYVGQVAPPEGWTLRLLPHDSGTALARFDRSTGIGASVQPLFINEYGPPLMIIVGSYYPLGVMRITDEVIKKIEQAARPDLGPAYSVSAIHAKTPDTNVEGFELNVSPIR